MLDRKTPPPFVQSTVFELLKPSIKTLSNGTEMYFVGGGDQEVIKVEIVMQAGRWFEKSPGVSQFTASLLNKGTSAKTSFDIASIFDRYGAHIEIHPGLDNVSVSVYSLTQYLPPVLDLLIEILTDATFSDRELQQHQSISIQNLKVNMEKTSFVASQLFRKKLFGADHPYGVELNENSISNISTNDLKSFYQRYFRNYSVFVSGKISDASKDLIVSKLSSLDVLPVEASEVATTASRMFNEVVDKEGSIQSSIRMGTRSLQRNHPDYASVIFVSHILGGYFGSRLMKNIREEKGLTYGIYASLHPLQRDAYMVIGADVNKENLGLTIDEIKKELRILRTEPVDKSELTTAKNHFIGSLQSEITTPFAHADKIKTIVLGNLPQDYYQRIIKEINELTSERIIELASEYFHEDKYSVISVG